jgi:C1A family cysteine protease
MPHSNLNKLLFQKKYNKNIQATKKKFNLLIKRIDPRHLKPTPYNPQPSLPTIIDLRSKFPPVFDQGQLGSCTANALCGLIAYDDPLLIGSRLFLYYNERKLENDIPDDAGALLSDGIQCLLNYGICSESEWPYDINQFATKPPNSCYTDALNHKALNVTNINNTELSMKNALFSGYPFVVGIAVYASFETQTVANTGLVPMPTINDQLLGGHAVVCVGYNDNKKHWIMRNSWGSSWGDNGYFYLPYNYLLDSKLSSDLWCINKMQL